VSADLTGSATELIVRSPSLGSGVGGSIARRSQIFGPQRATDYARHQGTTFGLMERSIGPRIRRGGGGGSALETWVPYFPVPFPRSLSRRSKSTRNVSRPLWSVRTQRPHLLRGFCEWRSSLVERGPCLVLFRPSREAELRSSKNNVID
jgi:hypothetical protein